ncbi:hypothetical protein P9112_011892 [Eukaryota sp. TZLM1-RC]
MVTDIASLLESAISTSEERFSYHQSLTFWSTVFQRPDSATFALSSVIASLCSILLNKHPSTPLHDVLSLAMDSKALNKLKPISFSALDSYLRSLALQLSCTISYLHLTGPIFFHDPALTQLSALLNSLLTHHDSPLFLPFNQSNGPLELFHHFVKSSHRFSYSFCPSFTFANQLVDGLFSHFYYSVILSGRAASGSILYNCSFNKFDNNHIIQFLRFCFSKGTKISFGVSLLYLLLSCLYCQIDESFLDFLNSLLLKFARPFSKLVHRLIGWANFKSNGNQSNVTSSRDITSSIIFDQFPYLFDLNSLTKTDFAFYFFTDSHTSLLESLLNSTQDHNVTESGGLILKRFKESVNQSIPMIINFPVLMLECISYHTSLADHLLFLSYSAKSSKVKLILSGDDVSISEFGAALFNCLDSCRDLFLNNIEIFYIPRVLPENPGCFNIAKCLSEIDSIYAHFIYHPFLGICSLIPTPLFFPRYSNFCFYNSTNEENCYKQNSDYDQSIHTFLSFSLSNYLLLGNNSLNVPLWTIESYDSSYTPNVDYMVSCLDIGCLASVLASNIASESWLFNSDQLSLDEIRAIREFDHSSISLNIRYSLVNSIGKHSKDVTYSGAVYSLSISNHFRNNSTSSLFSSSFIHKDYIGSIFPNLSDEFLSLSLLSCVPEVFKDSKDVYLEHFINEIQIESDSEALFVVDCSRILKFKKLTIKPTKYKDQHFKLPIQTII